jgi:hypothetical protein
MKTYRNPGTNGHRDKDLNAEYRQEIRGRVLTYRSVDGRDELTILPRMREADDCQERWDVYDAYETQGRLDACVESHIPNAKLRAV